MSDLDLSTVALDALVYTAPHRDTVEILVFTADDGVEPVASILVIGPELALEDRRAIAINVARRLQRDLLPLPPRDFPAGERADP